jgi:MSHA biogenesis protein MshM
MRNTTDLGPLKRRGFEMYLQHFGLRHAPLGKNLTEPWDDGVLAQLGQRFNWLLQSPGIGLLTGEPGVGKTAALRSLTQPLNPHRYQVLYQAETDFGRVDIYRGLARSLGLEPSYRRAQLWRDIKQRVHEMVDSKQLTPLWIIDEAQNLPAEFFRDFPSFLNFAFDSRDLMTVWLVGHPVLAQVLERSPYAALHSRIQVHVQLKPVLERERFALLIAHALKGAGSQHNLLADTGLEILRQASKGLPRQAGRILCTAMRLAVPKGLNHLPDEILQQAIKELQ